MVEKEVAAAEAAAATRREHAREAPWCVRLLLQQGGTSADDVDEALGDKQVKALLHHMGELTFAEGNKPARCKQLTRQRYVLTRVRRLGLDQDCLLRDATSHSLTCENDAFRFCPTKQVGPGVWPASHTTAKAQPTT